MSGHRSTWVDTRRIVENACSPACFNDKVTITRLIAEADAVCTARLGQRELGVCGRCSESHRGRSSDWAGDGCLHRNHEARRQPRHRVLLSHARPVVLINAGNANDHGVAKPRSRRTRMSHRPCWRWPGDSGAQIGADPWAPHLAWPVGRRSSSHRCAVPGDDDFAIADASNGTVTPRIRLHLQVSNRPQRTRSATLSITTRNGSTGLLDLVQAGRRACGEGRHGLRR